jgi:hypothetical protein
MHALLLITLILFPCSDAFSASLIFAWNPNPESDLAGYKIYYGTASGNYSSIVDVGNITEYTITGLEAELTYYFAVTAYDYSGNESAHSAEIEYTVPAVDSDGDGVRDDQDDFPNDPNEWLDTDGDGTGNNTDDDDDNDGMPDSWEIQYDLDPLKDDASEDPDGDGLSNLDEYLAGTDPTVSPQNNPPDAPVLYLPNNGNYVVLTPVLETEAFYDPDFNDSHAQTHWQITREEDSVSILDITSPSSLTSLTVPKLILDGNTSYLWRVRFYDNHGAPSEWSEILSFTTVITGEDAEGNGIPDHQEVGATLDLNEDGTADIEQAEIKCVNTEGGDTQIGISIVDSSTVTSIESLMSEDPNNPDTVYSTLGKPDDMPFGLISFKLILKNPGDQAFVTVYFSEPAPEGAKWYKYDSIEGRWQDYSAYAEFNGGKKSVELTFQDGGYGDADGTVNGIIVDPSGVGSASSSFSGSTGSGGSSSCFISTTAYGSSTNPHASFLRELLGPALAINFLLLVLIAGGKSVFIRKSIE